MQIRAGTVTVTNLNTRVISTEDSLTSPWSTISPGDMFIVSEFQVPFYVGALTAPGGSASGFWEVTLSAPYSGTTGADKAYAIISDFTASYGLPLIARGDAESALIYSRALALIDAQLAVLAGLAGGGGGGGAGPNWRIHTDGTLQLKNTVSGYHTIDIIDVDGVPSLRIGANVA